MAAAVTRRNAPDKGEDLPKRHQWNAPSTRFQVPPDIAVMRQEEIMTEPTFSGADLSADLDAFFAVMSEIDSGMGEILKAHLSIATNDASDERAARAAFTLAVRAALLQGDAADDAQEPV